MLVLAGILMVHVCLSTAYVAAMPHFNWPDEPAHFNYVRRLARGDGLDVMDRSAWAPEALERLKRGHFLGLDDAATLSAIAEIRYEAHQPPLYYSLAALVYALTRSLLAVKMLNLLLSGVAIVIGFAVAREIYPEDRLIPTTAALLLALVPMRCFMAVSISNDVAAEVMFGLFVLGALRVLGACPMGILIGVGVLTKANLLLALPLFAVWRGMIQKSGVPPRVEQRSTDRWRDVLVTAGAALVIISPWIVRNLRLYGWNDPLALQAGAWGSETAMVAAGGYSRPRLTLTGTFGIMQFSRRLFESWWGAYGWMEMFTGCRILAFYVLVSAVPAAGLFVAAGSAAKRRADRRRSLIGSWFGLALVLVLTSLVLYSRRDFQPQGRYVMLASAPIGVLYAVGIRKLLRQWAAMWVWVTSLGLVWINTYVVRHVIPWYLAR